MKVLLTHAWFLSEDPAELRVMKPYPPLGLLSLSAWLTQEGLEHEVYDSTFHSPDDLAAYIGSYKPDLIGLYSTLMTKLNVLRLIHHLRGTADSGSIRIIIGGPDAREHAEGYLEQGADLVIPGEGEETLAEVVRFYSGISNTSLGEIRGLVFKDAAARLIRTPERKFLDPDVLPVPDRGKINMDLYFRAWEDHHGYTSMTISSQRGCPYSCNWCSKTVFGTSYRRRSPSSVAGELMQLTEKYHPGQFWFTDDVFTIRKDWLVTFASELSSRNLRISYECISREDCLDEEMIALLVRTGCRKLWIGAESGSQRVLDLMNRKTDITRTIEMMRLARRAGIFTGTFLMLGYPGETKQDIIRTAAFLKQARPDEATITMAYPIQGTKFYEEIRSQFTRPYDWASGNERQIPFKKPYPPVFYRFAARFLMHTLAAAHHYSPSSRLLSSIKAIISRMVLGLFR